VVLLRNEKFFPISKSLRQKGLEPSTTRLAKTVLYPTELLAHQQHTPNPPEKPAPYKPLDGQNE
jgi:hypothetical protein